MADYTGEAFAELPELKDIGRDLEGYIKVWEEKYGGRGQAAKYAREWFDETSVNNDSTYIESFNDSELTWGKMFCFQYDPATRDRLSYFDNSPMVISLGRHPNGNELAMNLNFLPKEVRYWMVGEVFKVYQGAIVAAAAGKNWRRASEQKQVEIEYELLKQWLGKYGLDFCVRQYHKGRMRNLTVICYEDWIRAVMINWNNFDPLEENAIKQLYEKFLQKVSNR